jgi:hypothetical protein
LRKEKKGKPITRAARQVRDSKGDQRGYIRARTRDRVRMDID